MRSASAWRWAQDVEQWCNSFADVLWLAGISIAVTVPVSMLLARILRSQLYNVSATDPLVMGSAIALVIPGSRAAMPPARRAASVEPMKALRME